MGESGRASGWVSWTGGSWVDLPADARDRARQRIIEQHRARGPLAAVVVVRVYADAAEPHVSFTEDCTLGPDADQAQIAAVVERAREALDQWR